ncbi:flagellar M-ring protein FliF [Acidaminobacter sp. JC074]|uniref:flagellar basal-body MS-ring/collar protein FliF n=1 Tax=Acidaminobacter sp. JC074 TaxID=2530199 RepID=UPI001F0D76A1|nr:flagellar basal-body MS-ring/collar protein FliF [Acidaminobacter sp. JC074]MCH4888717.1 flagellar M-ring protein FliF [Acidaminobacter sp. JC074]
MAELIQRIRTQITTFFQSLDRRRRIWLAAGGLFVVAIVALILFLTRPTYVVLASGLEFDEMSRITTMLTEKSITYRDDGGNTLMVDKNDYTKARMAMAVDVGISQPNYTWTDMFNASSLTTNSTIQESQKTLIMANQLGDALSSLEGVSTATVQLHIAQKSSFVLSDPQESRASVILTLTNEDGLSRDQISGIVSFIKDSIENLPKENISIIDQTGMPLNKFSEDSDAFMASTMQEQKVSIEMQLEDKLVKFLGAVYGQPNVRVMVDATLFFDDDTTTSRTFVPPVEGETTGIIRSASKVSESVTATGAEGVPGTDSNTDDTTYPTGTSSGSDIESASETINYEINEINRMLTRAKGTITDIQVALLVNTDVLENNNMTEEQEQDLIELVTTAAGIETRKVNVMATKFTDNEMGYVTYESGDELISPGIPLWLVGLIVGVIALVVIIFFVLGRRRNAREREEEIARVQAEEEAKRQEELEEIQTNVEDKSSPKYQIEKFIDAKPEAVAALLRSWMMEM